MIGLFYEKGWAGLDLILRVGEPEEIREQLANINDWNCLVCSGQSLGPKSDQPKLKKLSSFLQTCEDRGTLENFKIKISTGELGCIFCAETKDELEKMRNFVLSKEEESYHEKLSALFDRLIESQETGKIDPVMFGKLSTRQYITTGISRDNYLD